MESFDFYSLTFVNEFRLSIFFDSLYKTGIINPQRTWYKIAINNGERL